MRMPTPRTFRLLAFTVALSLAAPAAEAYVFLQQWGVADGSWAFDRPIGIEVGPDGYVYVADPFVGRVQKFTRNGVFVLQLPSPGIYPAGNPYDLAVDVNGEVFVGDGISNVHVYSTTGSYLRTFPAVFPFSIAVDGLGYVYVSQNYTTPSGNVTQIQKFTRAGALVATFGSNGTGPGRFQSINCVFVDAAGTLYVVDNTSNVIQRLTTTGTYLGQWGSTGTGNGQFQSPSWLWRSPAGQILVTDGDNNRVQIFSLTGTYVAKFGSTGTAGGSFSLPRGITTDADGNIFTTEFGNRRVQKFGDTSVTTVATSWGRLKSLYR